MISDRKLEHLLICENYDVEFKDKTTGFEDIELIHNVLPEIDKQEIDLSTSIFGKKLNSPLFITDKFITDVLDMTVRQARKFFANHAALERRLGVLEEVGLEYIRLGQPATTLSGGEAQRIKLSRELGNFISKMNLRK